MSLITATQIRDIEFDAQLIALTFTIGSWEATDHDTKMHRIADRLPADVVEEFERRELQLRLAMESVLIKMTEHSAEKQRLVESLLKRPLRKGLLLRPSAADQATAERIGTAVRSILEGDAP